LAKKKQKDIDSIQMMLQRYRKAEAAVNERQQLWKELDMFDRGEQWKNVSIPPWIPKPVTNFIRYIRTLKRANLASAIGKANFVPISPQFEEQVARLQKAYDHVWETENIQRTLRSALDRGLLQGTSVLYVYNDDAYVGGTYREPYDPQNQLYSGKICVKRIPVANFYPDPDAYELESCKFIEVTEILSLQQVKNNPEFRKYCEEQGTDKKLKELNISSLGQSDSEAGTIFTRESNPLHNGQHIQGDEMVVLHCHWERKYNEEGKWDVSCTYYLKDTDFILLKRENIQPNVYPFAIYVDEEEENSFWGSSIIMDVFENQKIINKTAQIASIIGTLHQNPQKIVARESGINASDLAKTGTLPGKVWTTNADPQNSIATIQPPDIPRGLFDLEDRLKNDIREIVGVTEAYTGNSVGSLTTSTGVTNLIERATVRDKDKMIQIDKFVEDVSHLIVLTILYKWKDSRPMMNVAPNGQPQYEQFQPFDDWTIDNMEWRVRSDVYAKAPATQASKRQQADMMIQLQGQFQFNPPIITPEEWVRFQDFDMKEETLRRMESDRQKMEQQQAQDLAGQISQLAMFVNELQTQGAPEESIQQMVYQQAQQLLMQGEEQQQGGQMPTAPNEPQAPEGVTGQMAMMNMARGM
jgi:hypothetical protein